jgi:hypothetical protein
LSLNPRFLSTCHGLGRVADVGLDAGADQRRASPLGESSELELELDDLDIEIREISNLPDEATAFSRKRRAGR